MHRRACGDVGISRVYEAGSPTHRLCRGWVVHLKIPKTKTNFTIQISAAKRCIRYCLGIRVPSAAIAAILMLPAA